MPEFSFSELLPLGHDDTPYRLITTEHVSTVDTPLGAFLRVEPEALTLITQEAMRDIAHLLRPGHLQQLRNVLDDPEASDNDRFVALDLLQNANIAAGGVLPMCQDTGTAIVKAKKGQFVFTASADRAGGDEEAIKEAQAAFDKVNGLRETMFKGETLRGLLLTVYGFSVFGEKAGLAMMICFIAGLVVLLLSIAGFVHAFASKKADDVILAVEHKEPATV